MLKLNFQPKQTTKKILSFLDKKQKDVLEQRFGLGLACNSPKTLEAIGQGYGITRERVRQIEEDGLRRLRKSEGFAELRNIFSELKEKIEARGGIVHEKEFLGSFGSDYSNHVRFLLVLGNDFSHLKENDDFYHRWTTDAKKAGATEEALGRLHKDLLSRDLFSEKEIFSRLAGYAKNAGINFDRSVIPGILKISQLVDSNALGEWGYVSSPSIRPRGVRDLAYLAMKKNGSPMHFSEVAESIAGIFSRPVNKQTVHNELIKDERFVLVGRGLYALKEWGYEGGIVRDVIKKLLAGGPLSKEEIIKSVMRERYVKENTILINLQNSRHFKRNSEGNYTAVS